jgi:hypothetical protein
LEKGSTYSAALTEHFVFFKKAREKFETAIKRSAEYLVRFTTDCNSAKDGGAKFEQSDRATVQRIRTNKCRTEAAKLLEEYNAHAESLAPARKALEVSTAFEIRLLKPVVQTLRIGLPRQHS